MTANAAARPRTDPTAERDSALLAVYRLLHKYARRRVDHMHDREDLAQDAAVFFLEQFDPARCEGGAALSRFAGLMVRTAHYRRLNSRAAKVVAAPTAVEAVAVDRAERHVGERAVERLDAALNALTPAVRELLVERFGLGVQSKPLEKLCGGLSRQTAHARVKVAVKKLRFVMQVATGDEF